MLTPPDHVWDCTPYLQITSATKRAGKTRLLEVMKPLVPRAWLTGRVSAAALVRKVDRDIPTLLLDESDAAFKGEKEYAEALRGILDTGYLRDGRATLCVGQGSKITTRDFTTFGPKAIAGIGTLPGTIADRAIPIVLKRRTKAEKIDRWRNRDGQLAAKPIGAALAASVTAVLTALRTARPALPDELNDRQQDVWEPLLAIADEADGLWPTQACAAAKALSGGETDTTDDLRVDLLSDIRTLLTGKEAADILVANLVASTPLLATLVALPDRPWATFGKLEKPMTGHKLAWLLKPFDIFPTSDGTVRGYRQDAFNDAFGRLSAAHQTVKPSYSRFQSVKGSGTQ
jgi:hypothetical protein